MLRWTFRILIIALLVAFASFWVRSYWAPEIVLHEATAREGLTFTTRQCALVSSGGGVFLGYRHNTLTVANEAQAEKHAAQRTRNGWAHQRLEGASYGGGYFEKLRQPTRLGFGRNSQEITSENGVLKMQSYVFPYAAPAIFLALFPICWLFRAWVPAPKKRKLIASPEFADNDYLRSPDEPFAPRT